MVRKDLPFNESPSQTAGPYVHIGCTPNLIGINGVYDEDLGSSLVNENTKGERIIVTGRILDGEARPLTDALVEIWQADADGAYSQNPSFMGWGRQACQGASGQFRFETILPGKVVQPDGVIHARHISFWIAARGINTGLHTRMYFPEEEANKTDPVLTSVKNRAHTLIAKKRDEEYIFDIIVQGKNETVFFDV